MNREIQLFTTIDEAWLPYALMFIASVRRTTASAIRYTVFCPGHVEATRLRSWCAANQVSLSVQDFDEAIQRSPTGRSIDLRSPIAGMSACVYWGRYCAALAFDELPARLIYADVDMYAAGNLAPLMEIDLGSCSVGAVRYPHDQIVRQTGVPAGRYVNNGLLVFDSARFDGLDCIKKMQSALATGRTVFGPQCAFNMAMGDEIRLLDRSWNVQGEWRDEVGDRARLIHFTGNTKPWHALSVDPLRWNVRDLLRDVGCAEAWRPDLNPAKALRLTARRMRSAWRHA